MKKIFAVLIMVVFLMSFAGCKREQTAVTPSDSNSQPQTKIIKIDSDPQDAMVYIDKEGIGKTPLEYSLIYGEHNISISKIDFDVYETSIDVTKDKKEQSVMAILKPVANSNQPLMYGGIIAFNDRPIIRNSCPDFSYSGIYLNDTVDINGFTGLDSFDLVFPSGKKVHFDTEPTGDKDARSKDIRKFSKTVIFDEIGEYKIFSDNKIVIFGSGGYKEFKFQVLYKAKPVDTLTLGSLNRNHGGELGLYGNENTILLPIGKEVTVKLLLTDGKGNIARSKTIGLNNLKTDENGIVSIKIGSNRMDEGPSVVYGDILCWVCDYTTFDTNGKLIKSCFMKPNQKGELIQAIPENVPQKVSIINEDGHIYMPFDCSGLSLYDLGFKESHSSLLIHSKNPLIIYTNSSVSEDGGKSFENFGDNIKLKTIAIDPNKPNVIYGFSEDNPSNIYALFKSDDYGMHFAKIKNISLVKRIVVDPNKSNVIYITTDKELLKSTDYGKTWETFLNYSVVPWINPHNTDIIFARNQRTTDGGKTWESINLYKKNPAYWNVPLQFAFDPVNPNVVYGITYSHLFKSEDNGDNWAMPTSRYFFDLWNIAIDPTNPQKIYLGCREGILESDSGGKGFKNLSNPTPSLNANFRASVFVDSNGSVYSILCGIPLKMSQDGNWLPLNDTFLESGPDWKIIDGVFYVDVKTIKSDTDVVEITKDRITFYRLSYMGP